MISDCMFDKEVSREEMNGFYFVWSKHNSSEEERWRWMCRGYIASMEM